MTPSYALLNINKLLSPDLSTYRREELSRAVDTLERAGAIVWPKDNPCVVQRVVVGMTDEIQEN